VTKKLGELRLRTATVEIVLNAPSAEVFLDGKPMDPARLHGPTLIDAGEHALHASAPGFAPKDRTVTLAGGDHTTVRLELVSLAPKEAPKEAAPVPRRTPFWPGFAATGALAAGAVVSGAIMLSARSQLSNLQNTPGSDANERQNTASRANTAALVADVFTGLAAVAGGVSIYLSLTPHAEHAPHVAVSAQKIVMTGSF
jgi:hypothetical protein